MTVNRFVPGMCEISGMGGAYEKACRIMVSAGADWFEANPGVMVEKKGWTAPDESKWEKDNKAHDELEAYIGSACPGGGPSGAMHSAAMKHLMMLQMFGGWTEYVKESTTEFEKMYPLEALALQQQPTTNHNQTPEESGP